MTTYTSREGLEDRLLSVVPLAGQLEGQKDMTVEAIRIEAVDPATEWILEITGGRYNDLDQLVRIDMKCDENAKEVTSLSREETT